MRHLPCWAKLRRLLLWLGTAAFERQHWHIIWRDLFLPPQGTSVRKLIAWFGVLIGIRMAFHWPTNLTLSLLSSPVYGLCFLIMGVLLLITCNGGRRTPVGRIVAALGAGLYTTLVIDIWSAQLLITYFGILAIYALIGEVITE